MPQNDIVKDSIMREMRQEFMPREALKITFAHIGDKLEKIEGNINGLPHQLALQFESRFGDRIKKVEERLEDHEDIMDDLKAFKWKAIGALAVLVAIAKVAELFFHR